MESDMTNLSIGGGLYFLDILSNKARLYGDLMFNVNMIDVERDQTWVDTIKGDATSFGIVAELGLIHDWLNQYIIGNLYARAGYNFGFEMTERVGDTDYMNLKFDGYPILTPGYSKPEIFCRIVWKGKSPAYPKPLPLNKKRLLC
jgi:hypothetical protein